MGRKIKRKHIRDKVLNVRISTPAIKNLRNISEIMRMKYSKLISQADVIEWALGEYSINILRGIEREFGRQTDIQ